MGDADYSGAGGKLEPAYPGEGFGPVEELEDFGLDREQLQMLNYFQRDGRGVTTAFKGKSQDFVIQQLSQKVTSSDIPRLCDLAQSAMDKSHEVELKRLDNEKLALELEMKSQQLDNADRASSRRYQLAGIVLTLVLLLGALIVNPELTSIIKDLGWLLGGIATIGAVKVGADFARRKSQTKPALTSEQEFTDPND